MNANHNHLVHLKMEADPLCVECQKSHPGYF